MKRTLGRMVHSISENKKYIYNEKSIRRMKEEKKN